MYHKSYSFILRSQHCHSWSFTITGVLLTHYSLYKQNAQINEAILFLFSHQIKQLAAGCVYVCVCMRVCAWGWVACMKTELGVNGCKPFNSLSLISTANVSSRQLEAETIDMFMHHPSNPSMRWCVIHPDLNCRYQNRVLIIYTLCTVPLSPVLVPLQLHNDKLSFQAVYQFAHQNPIFTWWKPSPREVQCCLCL